MKALLSAYLAHVTRGEEVVVTGPEQPIARIVPIRATGIGDEERWQDWIDGSVDASQLGAALPWAEGQRGICSPPDHAWVKPRRKTGSSQRNRPD